jgi:hypothetical protein
VDSKALTFENFPQVARILKHLERKGFEDDEEGDAGPGVCVCVCVCVCVYRHKNSQKHPLA